MRPLQKSIRCFQRQAMHTYGSCWKSKCTKIRIQITNRCQKTNTMRMFGAILFFRHNFLCFCVALCEFLHVQIIKMNWEYILRKLHLKFLWTKGIFYRNSKWNIHSHWFNLFDDQCYQCVCVFHLVISNYFKFFLSQKH